MYKSTYLYARVSSTKGDTFSQMPELRRWASANDTSAEIVPDVGTGKNMSRKGIQTIIRGIECGMTKCVVVVSINRLGRNVTQVCQFIDLCLEHGVKLISLRESFDLSTPFGKLIA